MYGKGAFRTFFLFRSVFIRKRITMIYLKKFDNHAQYEAYASSALIRPNVSHCVAEDDMHYSPYVPDYSSKYLTFIARESGTFSFSGNAINYSLDNGETWTSLASNTASPTVAAGNKIMWKATGLTPTSNGIGKFSATGNFDVEGNVMSLYYGDNFVGQTNLTGKDYAFHGLFKNNNKLISASNLILPATTLERYSYYNMFFNCTSLTTAPELPATTLSSSCYSGMFVGCTHLTTAPELPAITLEQSCYSDMFTDCISLTTAPELPATTLAEYCYYCMFTGCANLNYIKCLATDISATDCTYGWVDGTSSTGTFTADCHAEWLFGINGIPQGWTRITVGNCPE